MHHEFNAPEMTLSRNLAGKTVREHSSESFDELRTNLVPEKTQHVWTVMYFYQRLWLAIKSACTVELAGWPPYRSPHEVDGEEF